MQETKIRTPADDLPPSRPGWIRAVAILGVGALLIATLYGAWQAVASSDDPQDPAVPGNPDPDFSLTDEQAITRFDQLRDRALQATRNQDLALILSVFTETSPMKDRLRTEIQRLRENGVREQSEFERLDVTVTENSPSLISLLEVTDYFPCFKTESGKNVTVGPEAIRQEVEWTLALDGDRWLIENSVIREDRELKANGHC